MLDRAISEVSKYDGTSPSKVKTALVKHFGGASSSTFASWINVNLKYLRLVTPMSGFTCSPSSGSLCGSSTLAVTIWCVPFVDVRICSPYYFSFPQEERSSTIIHEWAHKYGCNFDVAYDWQSKYDELSTFMQLLNADSFGEFVKDIQ